MQSDYNKCKKLLITDTPGFSDPEFDMKKWVSAVLKLDSEYVDHIAFVVDSNQRVTNETITDMLTLKVILRKFDPDRISIIFTRCG